jgi:Transposase IS116/IS110/IS902 family
MSSAALATQSVASPKQSVVPPGCPGPAGSAALMTIPGVDATLALSIVAAVGDFTRFRTPDKLVSYLGLNPRVRQSGGRVRALALRTTVALVRCPARAGVSGLPAAWSLTAAVSASNAASRRCCRLRLGSLSASAATKPISSSRSSSVAARTAWSLRAVTCTSPGARSRRTSSQPLPPARASTRSTSPIVGLCGNRARSCSTRSHRSRSHRLWAGDYRVAASRLRTWPARPCGRD